MSARETPLVRVAEDEPDILALVASRLERAGTWSSQRPTARRRLDVMMPKLNGIDVTRALREDERTKRLPVILLTARVQEADVARGFEAGADDYIKKPFSPQELRARVQAILGRR